MRYEWNKAKREETLLEREVDFASLDHFNWETSVHQSGDPDGETRWSTLGLIGNRLYHVIWTERGQSIRIIRPRKANSREVAKYVEQQD